MEPPRPAGAYFMYMMKNREKIVGTLPAKHTRKEASQALAAKWKTVPDEKKQEWKNRNNKIKEAHDAWVEAGGIPAGGIRAQAKARKDSKAKMKQDPRIDLTAVGSVELVAEVNRRVDDGRVVGGHVEAAATEQAAAAPNQPDGNAAKKKQPRRAPDESAEKKRKVAKEVEVPGTEVPPPTLAASKAKPPIAKKLLKDFGDKVAEDQKGGLKLWLEARLEKIVSKCDPLASDKEVWKAAKKRWNELADEQRQKWIDAVA